MIKNLKLSIIIITVFFGLAGGVAGGLFSRTYLAGDYFDSAGNLDTSGTNGLIFRNAGRITIEQNVKVAETIDSAQASLVGIYKRIVPPAVDKKNLSVKAEAIDFSKYYLLDQYVGQGIAATSDGWIITAFEPSIAGKTKRNSKDYDKLLTSAWKDYVVIASNGNIYNIDRAIADSLTEFAFVHLAQAGGLPVREFTDIKDIKPGQLAAAVSWRGKSHVDYLVSLVSAKSVVYPSDNFLPTLELRDFSGENWGGAALFSLDGSVYGIMDNRGKIYPVGVLEGAIKNLLKNNSIKRAELGLFYLDISRIIPADSGNKDSLPKHGSMIFKNNDGVALAKNGAAISAGLKEGDIMTAINDKEVNAEYSLPIIILSFVPGEIINIAYQRDGKKNEINVKLQ